MKKLFKSILVLALAALVFTGCSSSSTTTQTTTSTNEETTETTDKKIVVGATAVPHAMILNDVVKGILEKEGWELEVVEFTDYVTPNTSLEEGEIDANYFQTLGYLKDQNETRGLHLSAVAGIHYEPMTIFAANLTAVDELKDGDTIVIPNDFDNEKRALSVLDQAGILTYDPEKVADDGSPLDGIVENPLNLTIQEVEAALVPQYAAEVTAVVANGNYALEANLKDSANAIFVETPDIEARTNYLVVKEGNEETEKTKALVAAITSPEVKSYIEENYGSAVICVFD
ncbi:MAG: MetQ/NlpA family ABC transporter substrate-binding protein [Firmicutes bacterium]|nr:MetQ/NlpA family ABC transporter substrate-binding protein [Bacillota bacterium]